MKTHLGPPRRDFNAGEFLLVTALSFGLWIAASLDAALSYSNRPVEFTDAALAGTVGYEVVFGAVILFILRAREWRWGDFDFHYSHGTTVLGVLLAGILIVLWWGVEQLIGKVPNVVTASMTWVLAVSIVNPLFEELLVLGYVVQAMRGRFGLTIAMHVSIAIRILYHLYQGPLVVIPLAIFAVGMTLVYVRLGRLWPVVVAHGILDFVALADLF